MSDFDERLARALGDLAEDAPEVGGLAQAARGRARARRQRLAVAGAVAAVLAIAIPAAILAGSGDDPARPSPGPAADPPQEFDDLLVSCGGDQSWPVAAMEHGSGDVVPEDQVRAAFADVLAKAPMDAPPTIRRQGADRTPYVVLAADDKQVTLGVGRWSVDGPHDDGMVMRLDRADGGLSAAGWGGCRLEVALPEGRSRVEVAAPKGGVDPTTTEIVVMVNELQCSSGRDVLPYLSEPVLVEEADRVLVTFTSEDVELEEGVGVTCVGNPSVPVTVLLDDPLGDRQLYDGGTWPPTPIEVASAAELWQTAEHEDARVDLPPTWRAVECAFEGTDGYVVHGPEGAVDPCEFGIYTAFYGSATFDPAHHPGVVIRSEEDGEVTWSGYVSAGDWVISASTTDREVTLRILASARVDGQPVVVADRWETGVDEDAEWRFPTGWGVDEGARSSYDVVVGDRPSGERVEQSLPEQIDGRRVRMHGDVGPYRVTVTAPTQAVAELVLASVGVAD